MKERRFSLKQNLDLHPKNVKTATCMAFVVRRGKVVAVGYNRRVFPNAEKFSQHAEIAAIRKAGMRARGSSIYVLRFKKDGTYGLAKPCLNCSRVIERVGIVRVYYSTEQWNQS